MKREGIILALESNARLHPVTFAISQTNRTVLKWIKQHLRNKSYFFGTSEHVVKIQIWIAVPVYLMSAIITSDSISRQVLFDSTVFESDCFKVNCLQDAIKT